jgi:hypothetical protein
MVLVNAGGRWIASTTVTYGGREVGKPPPRSVAAFANAAATFEAAVAESNCDVAYDFTVSGVPRGRYCKTVVAPDAVEHRVLAGNPPLTLRPLGGTADVQFLRSVIHIPKRVDRRGRTYYVTIPVVHTSRAARAHGASNPYLVGTAYTAPTPADVARHGPYTARVRRHYVSTCTAGGGTTSRCACEIDMIAAIVPFPDRAHATPGVEAACAAAERAGATSDERAVAHVALGRDLVPGYLCSAEVSTDYLIVGLGGTRYTCARRLGARPPDRTVRLTRVRVTGARATATGIDARGLFTLILVRRGARWLVDDFGSSG